MRQVDFSSDRVVSNIFKTATPLLLAQILNLLYNIVDRIYISKIPEIGTAALGAVGLTFPVILIITAFANLYGTGGSPLFAIERGKGDKEEAGKIMDICFFLIIFTAAVLFVITFFFTKPILTLFGASDNTMQYAYPYLHIYVTGTLFSMIATGMNPFINSQGFPMIGMMTVIIGAVTNIILDPIFIFSMGMGVSGAALATVISQFLSAAFVTAFLFSKKPEYRLHIVTKELLKESGQRIKRILGLGSSGFVININTCLLQIVSNKVLVATGGDMYLTVMSIILSVRQVMEVPVMAFGDGTSPLISYNYGARQPGKIKKAAFTMTAIFGIYTLIAWLLILLFPEFFISIFSTDKSILQYTIPALHTYFLAFIFMTFQFSGQTMFRALGKSKYAIFFSLLRKAFLVIPLTLLLPLAFGLGPMGVFMAEPISNVIGGTACFLTMLKTQVPEIRALGKGAPGDAA
ncbi:MAG: MATE family efflux transporter [Lachnospiraceae bacterium]|nr:MATE family efflux transporter [Lachnospiraceae bacterium]